MLKFKEWLNQKEKNIKKSARVADKPQNWPIPELSRYGFMKKK